MVTCRLCWNVNRFGSSLQAECQNSNSLLESVICLFNYLLACFVFYFPPEVCGFNNVFTLVFVSLTQKPES